MIINHNLILKPTLFSYIILLWPHIMMWPHNNLSNPTLFSPWPHIIIFLQSILPWPHIIIFSQSILPRPHHSSFPRHSPSQIRLLVAGSTDSSLDSCRVWKEDNDHDDGDHDGDSNHDHDEVGCFSNHLLDFAFQMSIKCCPMKNPHLDPMP